MVPGIRARARLELPPPLRVPLAGRALLRGLGPRRRARGPLRLLLPAIKAAIVRREPDFDERDHGFSTFSRLLEEMEKEGLMRREQGAKGQWYVVPA